MTPDRAKELLPIISAFAEGKVIQYETATTRGLQWRDLIVGELDLSCNLRIKPEAKLRPFTQDEAMRFRLFRHEDGRVDCAVAFVTSSFQLFNGTYLRYLDLNDSWTCSTGIPNSKGELEWQRCGTAVEE